MNCGNHANIATTAARHLFMQQTSSTHLRPQLPRHALLTLCIDALDISFAQGARLTDGNAISTKIAMGRTKVRFWKSALATHKQMIGTGTNTCITTRAQLQKIKFLQRPRRAYRPTLRPLPHPTAQQAHTCRVQWRVQQGFDAMKHGSAFILRAILPYRAAKNYLYHQRVNPAASFHEWVKLLPITSSGEVTMTLAFTAPRPTSHA
jgi:hypothetical protein